MTDDEGETDSTEASVIVKEGMYLSATYWTPGFANRKHLFQASSSVFLDFLHV